MSTDGDHWQVYRDLIDRAGVHTALVALHEDAIPPFEDGYEGTPFNDFAGRLDDWEWPDRPRS